MDANRFILISTITLALIYGFKYVNNAYLDSRGCYTKDEWLYCTCDANPGDLHELRSGNTKVTKMFTFAKGDNNLHPQWSEINVRQRIKQLYMYNCIAQPSDLRMLTRFANLALVKLHNVSVDTLDFNAFELVRHLIVNDSPLETFEGYPSWCKRLERLTLNDTALRTLPFVHLQKLPVLKELHASGVYLESHHDNVCDRLPKLKFYNGASCSKRFGTTRIKKRQVQTTYDEELTWDN